MLDERRLGSEDVGRGEPSVNEEEARRGRRGVGGKGLYGSGGGVRLTKLWKDGTLCSIPLNDDEDPFMRTGGLLRARVGCGFGMFHALVSPYVDSGLASMYMIRYRRFVDERDKGWHRRHWIWEERGRLKFQDKEALSRRKSAWPLQQDNERRENKETSPPAFHIRRLVDVLRL